MTGPPFELRDAEIQPDARAKLTGEAVFTDDRFMPGVLWASVATSPVAYGRIESIDTSAAAAMPGVVMVATAAEIGRRRHGRRLADQPVLCWDRVLFIGDRTAVVVAETRAEAEAAAARIAVDITEEEPLLDLERVTAENAPILHPEAQSYRYSGGRRPEVPHPNVQGHATVGLGPDDIEAVFASAAHVFEEEYRTPATHAGYIEPRVCLAWNENGITRVATTNKGPFRLHQQLADTLDVDSDRLEVVSGHIGGDFGGKGQTIDEYLCVLLARSIGRPVKMAMTWAAELAQGPVRHSSLVRLRTGVTEDGRFIAHSATVLYGGGAYASAKPVPDLTLPGATSAMIAYHIPAVRIDARTLYTNSVPGGHVRAPGQSQVQFAGESHVDSIARRLGIDPYEIRTRNALGPGMRSASGLHIREPRAVEVLNAVRTVDRHPPADDGLVRGHGVALAARHVGGGEFPLRAVLSPDATFELVTGLPDQGAGAWMVMQRVFAAELSVDPERVSVRYVPTGETRPDRGIGSSRSTHLGSRAAQLLAGEVKSWLDARLAEGLELRADVFVRRDGTDSIPFAALVTADLVPDPVEFEVLYREEESEDEDHDFVALAVDVAVDERTGVVTVEQATLAVDVGAVINPTAHRGQLEGGFMFGLGEALMTQLRVRDGAVVEADRQLFRIPALADVVRLTIIELPTEVGPGAYGAKSVGELANPVVAPAIANALADATGVRVPRLPLDPESVFEALTARDGEVGARGQSGG
ncbi:MAG TPA: xanthine dehydrogenase family protein molybdopterin-binding subunit [Acidimicrobiia bacterium]|nr:xanthine dehydrogenase family protein molybdopterin-binding subunit [Acidimicrobiia bacterium]